jgi:cell division protein FtsL
LVVLAGFIFGCWSFTINNRTNNRTNNNQQQAKTKSTKRTTHTHNNQASGEFFMLSVHCWLSWLDLFLVVGASQSTTEPTTELTTTINNNLKQNQQSNGWGVSLTYDSLLFLYLVLFRPCVCAWSVTTINITQQQATINQQQELQEKQQKQLKQQQTQQSNGWGVSLAYDSLLFLLLVLFRFCVCAWSVTTINITQQQINKKLQQKQQKQQQDQEEAQSATVDEAQPQQNTVT